MAGDLKEYRQKVDILESMLVSRDAELLKQAAALKWKEATAQGAGEVR